MAVLAIKDQTEFSAKVLNSSQPVLVDFWAPWCGPCKMVGPEVEAVAEAYDGKVIVVKINVDEVSQVAASYNVMSIPTLIVFKNGKEAARIVGYRPRKDITAALDGVLR